MATRRRTRLGPFRKSIATIAPRMALALVAVSFAFSHAWAQSPSQSQGERRPTFDVASVKPNKSSDNRNRVQYQTGGRFAATN